MSITDHENPPNHKGKVENSLFEYSWTISWKEVMCMQFPKEVLEDSIRKSQTNKAEGQKCAKMGTRDELALASNSQIYSNIIMCAHYHTQDGYM